MVDYEFYQADYHGGAISEAEWSEYEARAAAQLSRYKRTYTVTAPDEKAESRAVCAMAEAFYGFDLIANGAGGAVQSASIGSVSVGYGSAGAQALDMTPKGQSRELYRCACLYLDIYRGCG